MITWNYQPTGVQTGVFTDARNIQATNVSGSTSLLPFRSYTKNGDHFLQGTPLRSAHRSPRSSPCNASKPTSAILQECDVMDERKEVVTQDMSDNLASTSACLFDTATEGSARRKASASHRSWSGREGGAKTSRRRALAFCLALGALRPISSSHRADYTDSGDMITMSTGSGDAYRTRNTLTPNLVTVALGTSNADTITDLKEYRGGEFEVSVPAHWVESKSQIATGYVLRYEDSVDPSTNVIVLKSPSPHSRIEDFGSPDEFIRRQAYLLTGSNQPLQLQDNDDGVTTKQRFPLGSISIANIINVERAKSKQGLTYYTYEIVTREGGKSENSLHQLVSAVVNDGVLYVCQVQTGEQQWHQKASDMARNIVESFQISGFKIRV